MKGTPKSCSCTQCKYGKGTETGHHILNKAERKHRRRSKQLLEKAIKSEDVDAIVDPAPRSERIS